MKERLLIVEDDEAIANILKEHVEKEGYEVTWASTGKEGLEDFKKENFQLAMIDIMLPEMEGFSLCKNIRWISEIPILIISAKQADLDKVKGLKLGADDYITKPFSLIEISARVEAHLRRYRKKEGANENSNSLEFKNDLTILLEENAVVLKEKNSIIGNQDYWIDKEHWFLIKSSLESGNIKSISEYTKLDFSPKLEDSLFIQKLPSDVKIEDMDQVGKNNEKVIDLKEGVKIAGKSILCLEESSDYKLKTVTYLDAKAISHKEINQNYEKNGVPAFTLTTILNDNKDSKDDEDKLPGEKDITVRGIKGTVIEDIKCISWTENNLRYSVLIQDPNLKLDDWKKIVESLTLTN
ncbi:response regulator transcription factor [Clostridium sp. PL3]|uniref:Response regulator transcription factor n=1 Tax=Clostridium thailandense TaxID=2794346 RepID=A0A949TNF9_9CLOT|nr:response regulator transcription factor [Clostridium thailandense]MBV7272487.1 response regulator transcription factor [Clostridium thailandense]